VELRNNTNAALSYGENTEQEMCLMFAIAWPLEKLVNGSLLSLVIPGALADVDCLD
jgi:hypothetical protein